MTEEELNVRFEKLGLDAGYALSTHFENLADRVTRLENQIKIQNKVIKELWAFKKQIETEAWLKK